MLLIQKALAETIGTFAMVFVGVGSILLSEKYPASFSVWLVPLAWGLTIALMIVALGSVSGAHFNPAVTLVFAVSKRIPFSWVWFYWIAQLMGGLTALILLEVIKKQ